MESLSGQRDLNHYDAGVHSARTAGTDSRIHEYGHDPGRVSYGEKAGLASKIPRQEDR